LSFFDCFTTFGVPCIPPYRYAGNVGELIEEMDFCGISQAIVMHISQRELTPITGNSLLLREIEQHRERLYPIWAILPHHCGEQPEAGNFISNMRDNDVRALIAYPDDHGYDLDILTFGELFEQIQAYRIPLYLQPDYRRIKSILADFPDMVIVSLRNGPHGQDRYFRPILERYENFHLDTSTMLMAGGIEDLVSMYGARRLLFGTYFPANSSGAALMRIHSADISDKDKELICYENINRLMQGVITA